MKQKPGIWERPFRTYNTFKNGTIMNTAMRRIKQVTIGILAVLSLSVSSVAACMCSHHEPTTETETRSCHGPTKTSHHQNTDSKKHSYFDESCTCLPPSANLSVKSEGFKLKKHPSAVAGKVHVRQNGFYSPTPATKLYRLELLHANRSDRPPSARGPPLS